MIRHGQFHFRVSILQTEFLTEKRTRLKFRLIEHSISIFKTGISFLSCIPIRSVSVSRNRSPEVWINHLRNRNPEKEKVLGSFSRVTRLILGI